MLISTFDYEVWPNFIYRGARSVIQCINVANVLTTVVVAVVVNGFFVGKILVFRLLHILVKLKEKCFGNSLLN